MKREMKWNKTICASCRYRARLNNGGTEPEIICFYIAYTGHRRGCPPENCKRYVKGDPQRTHNFPRGYNLTDREDEHETIDDIDSSIDDVRADRL